MPNHLKLDACMFVIIAVYAFQVKEVSYVTFIFLRCITCYNENNSDSGWVSVRSWIFVTFIIMKLHADELV